jgi:hypothetical protein
MMKLNEACRHMEVVGQLGKVRFERWQNAVDLSSDPEFDLEAYEGFVDGLVEALNEAIEPVLASWMAILIASVKSGYFDQRGN